MKKILIILFFAISSSLFAQTVLTIEGTTVNNTDDTWLGVNIPSSTPTTFTYRNNSITSVNNHGYMLHAGDETPGSTNNNLDGSIITGNKFTWNGTDMTVSTHGVFLGHNINDLVKYNYLKGVPYGILPKSNGMICTSGGIAYNITIDAMMGANAKGISGVRFFNNTFYSSRTPDGARGKGQVQIYVNDDAGSPGFVSTDCKVFNNIFYTRYQILNIVVDQACLPGFESDYNIFYCEAGTPIFMVSGEQKTFTEWQALGYDTHSFVVNPNFINFTNFVPSKRLDYGTDLGATWQTGLSIDAVWGTTDPATTNQNGTWQVGARVYAGKVYYLSPTGDDATGNGSIGSPWFSLNKAWTVVAAGDIIFMRGGTYAYNTQQVLQDKNGTSGNFIKIWAYPGETPNISRSESYNGGNFNDGVLIQFSNYLHLKGIKISGYTQPVTGGLTPPLFIQVTNNCIFEQMEFTNNGGSVGLSANCTGNLFLNCDSHHNYDPYTAVPYDNADGFDSATSAGSTNTFSGCRSWSNSDDGFDFYRTDGIIIVQNCWAWHNGYREDGITTGGNGWGFKLGITLSDLHTQLVRTVTNCLAFVNRQGGITQAGTNGIMHIYNNTTYNNTGDTYTGGISFGDISGIAHIVRNNIAYDEMLAYSSASGSIHDHNTWNSGFSATASDFVSLDSTGVSGSRQADGSLPVMDFLRLASTSDLIGAGVDVGLPFSGMHPDIGAFEFAGENHPPSIMNQSFEIDENSPDGTVAGTVVASDPDMDQTLEYSIVSGDTDGAFTINDSTGVLSVANGAALNVDFALVVKVQDNYNLSSQATITINVIPTGIESTGNNSTIKAYPNPVYDELIIEIEGNNDRQDFEILNSTGNIVFKGNLSERTVVSASNFSAGVYYIRLQNGKTFKFRKIVKV